MLMDNYLIPVGTVVFPNDAFSLFPSQPLHDVLMKEIEMIRFL